MIDEAIKYVTIINYQTTFQSEKIYKKGKKEKELNLKKSFGFFYIFFSTKQINEKK